MFRKKIIMLLALICVLTSFFIALLQNSGTSIFKSAKTIFAAKEKEEKPGKTTLRTEEGKVLEKYIKQIPNDFNDKFPQFDEVEIISAQKLIEDEFTKYDLTYKTKEDFEELILVYEEAIANAGYDVISTKNQEIVFEQMPISKSGSYYLKSSGSVKFSTQNSQQLVIVSYTIINENK